MAVGAGVDIYFPRARNNSGIAQCEAERQNKGGGNRPCVADLSADRVFRIVGMME